jgi:hypothetical protein
MASNINMSDVMSVMDENECPLKMKLSREGRDTPSQYYSLRYKYCAAKFNEIYGKKPAVVFNNLPNSIPEFWDKCNRVIQKVIRETGAQFAGTGIVVGSADLGSFTIDAVGKTKDRGTVIFKIIFGGSWRGKYAIQLVKELDYAFDAGIFEVEKDEIGLVAVIAGDDESDDINKAIRVVQKEAEYAKNGNVKRPSWAMMRDEFNAALQKTKDMITNINTKDYDHVETKPLPTNCGFCPFHNTVIVPSKTCTGFYHDA